MDRLLKRKSNIYYLIAIVYMIISVTIGVILQNGLVIFLAWNMFLATLVLLISEILVFMFKMKTHPVVFIGIFLIWILFFPNSMYMLTDFIHIQNYQFFESYADVYHLSLMEWIVFLELVVGALFASRLGITAIINLEVIFKKYIKKYYYLGLSFLFLISSIGIFIGRFLRLNSWNIFDLFTQIGTIFSHGTFLLGFVGIFFLIHWFIYFLFTFNGQNIYNKNKESRLEENT